ncbi:MAG TPA: patatin-like phospholipase family protein [Candidatus Kapabacteria bacterium]|nr:patatin-like phospholipase family protein [Candidatus Kapabacteria bacterium]
MSNIRKIFAAFLLFLIFQSGAAAEILKITYPSMSEISPRVALVLSGGGARGISQVGSLEVLEENRIPYHSIIGTSIGSIIGGLLASGYSPFELDSLINSINWNDIFSLKEQNNRTDLFLDQKIIEDRSLITFRFKNFKFVVPEAISAGDQFNITLQRVFWNSLYKPHGNFDNLKFPFRVVATDIVSGESISQKSGNIITAIRASATVPLRYTPIRTNGQILVDGGIFANIPAEQALEFSPDLIIAINTVSPKLNSEDLNTPWNIADQLITISMDKFTRKQKEYADFIITPNIGRHKNTDFSHLDTLIRAGRIATEHLVPLIQQKYRSKFHSKLNEYHKDFSIDLLRGKSIATAGFDSTESEIIEQALASIFSQDQYNDLVIKLLETDKYKQIELIIFSDTVKFVATKFPSLASINLAGVENPAVAEFAQNYVRNNPSLPLSPRGITTVKEDLLKKYRSEGYSYAIITNERVDNFGNLFLTIDEGTIGEIVIIGNEETSDFLIQRELKFKVGQVLNAEKLVRGWNNLVKTGLFSNVEIDIEENLENAKKVVIVKVTEGGTQTLRIGGKVDSERYGQAAIDAIQENLFNAGVRLSARTTIGSRNQDYVLLLENPSIFKTDFSLSAAMYYSYRDINIFSFERTSPYHFKYNKAGESTIERFGGIANFGRQLDKNGTISFAYRLEKQRYFAKNAAKPNFSNISTIKVATIFDSEDRSFLARSGQRIELYLETGAIAIEPSVSFSKAYFYYHHNLTIENVTIRPAVSFGAADKTLPQAEFFSLGGQSSFYGLREDAERGRQIFTASLEARYKLPFQIYFDTYLSARYDLGNVWLQTDEIALKDFLHGGGIAFEMDTPLGPGRFAVGRSFYFKENGEIAFGRPALYFSIGMKL